MRKLIENFRKFIDNNEGQDLSEAMADLKAVRNKYKDDPLMKRVINVLEDNDPSDNHKYIQWMSKQIANKIKDPDLVPSLRDITYEVLELVDKFHTLAPKKSIWKGLKGDINQYRDIRELEMSVKRGLEKLELAKREEEERSRASEQAKEESEVIHDDDKFIVIRPTSEHASCYYGRGAKWCISATEFPNMFDQYTQDGLVFYFVIDKTRDNSDPLKRVAWQGNSGGFHMWWDAPNNQISRRAAEHQFNETDAALGKDIIAKMEEHLESNLPDGVAVVEEKVQEILEDFESKTTSRTSLYADVDSDEGYTYISAGAETKLYLSVPEDFLTSGGKIRLTEEQEEEVIDRAMDLVYDKIGFYIASPEEMVENVRIEYNLSQGDTKYTIRIPISPEELLDVERLEDFAHEIKELDERVEGLDHVLHRSLVKDNILPLSFHDKIIEQIKGDRGVSKWKNVKAEYDLGDVTYSFNVNYGNRNKLQVLDILQDTVDEIFTKKILPQSELPGFETNREPPSIRAIRSANIYLYRRGDKRIEFTSPKDDKSAKQVFNVLKYMEEYPDTFRRALEPNSGTALSESLRGDKCIKIKIKQG